MEARQTRMILAAGGILVVLGAVIWLVTESSTPMAKDVDAGADAGMAPSANASASASASANADADGSAVATGDTDASVTPDAHVVFHGNATDASSAADAAAPATSAALTTATGDAGAKSPRGGPTITLDESGEGKTVDLAVGQVVVLMLGANPTSGFDWGVTKAPAALGTPDMGFVSGGSDQMGAPGKRRITWTVKSALPAGEQTVELGYRRGFEQGVAPLKSFRFKVRAAH